MFSLVSGVSLYSPDDFDYDIKTSLCITGHRESAVYTSLNDDTDRRLAVSAVKMMLYRYIDMACEAGYRTFLTGLAVGTDLWASEYILRKKRRDSRISLVGVIPYLRHAEYFPSVYRSILRTTELNADKVICMNSDPQTVYNKSTKNKGLYRLRNYYMIDHSSAVIAFLNRDRFASGTRQTVLYAEKSGVEVYSFGMEEIMNVIMKSDGKMESVAREISFMRSRFAEIP